MNNYIISCFLLLISGTLQALSISDTLPDLNNQSPVVLPVKDLNILVLYPIKTDTISNNKSSALSPAVNSKDSLTTYTLKLGEEQKEYARNYYQKVHQRLDGFLRQLNTEKGININSYHSHTQRSGKNDTDLYWEIAGISHHSHQQEHRQLAFINESLLSIVQALKRYEFIEGKTLPWEGMILRFRISSRLSPKAKQSIAPPPLPWQIQSDFIKIDDQNLFLIQIDAPFFFQQAYARYLNQIAEIERNTRRLLMNIK